MSFFFAWNQVVVLLLFYSVYISHQYRTDMVFCEVSVGGKAERNGG